MEPDNVKSQQPKKNSGEGGAKLLEGVGKTRRLRVLDLSWNSIGSSKGRAFAFKLGEVLAMQSNLLHMDISNNSIKDGDCAIIANNLAANHSLWGFHVMGNRACMDAKGFMHPQLMPSAENAIGNGHVSPRINGTKMVISGAVEETVKVKRIHNCWLCEGWNEVFIQFVGGTFIG